MPGRGGAPVRVERWVAGRLRKIARLPGASPSPQTPPTAAPGDLQEGGKRTGAEQWPGRWETSICP